MKRLLSPASLGIAMLVILFGSILLYTGAYLIGWQMLLAEMGGAMLAFAIIVYLWLAMLLLSCGSWTKFARLFVGLWSKPSG